MISVSIFIMMVDSREMLMRRSICFPGISPKVEFATMSVIEECDGKDIQPQPASPPYCRPSPAKQSPARRRPVREAVGSPRQTLKGKDLSLIGQSSGYEQPTVASQARALSPYTHRRMCQLSEEARQRLSYLQLGPFNFKKETEAQIPFVVGVYFSCSLTVFVYVCRYIAQFSMSYYLTSQLGYSISTYFTLSLRIAVSINSLPLFAANIVDVPGLKDMDIFSWGGYCYDQTQ